MIKTNIKQQTVKIDFPRLMRYNKKDGDFTVLFSSRGTGMVVESTDDDRPVGYHSHNWSMGSFSDFHGTLTLENGT